MLSKIFIGIIICLLIIGISILYMKDSTTAKEALLVEKYIKGYCQQHKHYPKIEMLENKFPTLYPNNEWYYWPNDAHTLATFQYPMTLPLPSAPGQSKVSEFFPIIYSYAVRHPCKDLF